MKCSFVKRKYRHKICDSFGGRLYMIETISENDEKRFKEKVNKLLSQGYKISSTDCGYVDEVGGNVYDCEYWMAILIKE